MGHLGTTNVAPRLAPGCMVLILGVSDSQMGLSPTQPCADLRVLLLSEYVSLFLRSFC